MGPVGRRQDLQAERRTLEEAHHLIDDELYATVVLLSFEIVEKP